MKKLAIMLVSAMLVFSLSQKASAVLLDFETLYNGDPVVGGSAANEYAPLGVTFTGGGTLGQPVFYNQFAPNGGFIGTFDRTGGGAFFDLNIFFSVPVYNVSGDVVINDAHSMAVTAYDSLDNEIQSMTIPAVSSPTGYPFITGSFNFSSSVAVDYITLLPDHQSVAAGLDNLQFDAPAPVPEPATMLLLGSGLVGLVGFRKRLRRN